MPTVNFKEFIHVYHQHRFRTLLLDVVPVDDGKADDIKSAMMSVCDFYNLKEDSLITNDGAFANIRCFGTRRLVCIEYCVFTSRVYGEGFAFLYPAERGKTDNPGVLQRCR